LGITYFGSGRYSVGRNSPEWWHASAPKNIKDGGEIVTRANAQRWPTAC
jgi:hypothetical protein